MGSRISLHFALLMPGGEEIDTTRRSKPASLTLGDGNLLPGFEEALIGLTAGDDAQLVIPADKAFGERAEANVRLLARSMFADLAVRSPWSPDWLCRFKHRTASCPAW